MIVPTIEFLALFPRNANSSFSLFVSLCIGAIILATPSLRRYCYVRLGNQVQNVHSGVVPRNSELAVFVPLAVVLLTACRGGAPHRQADLDWGRWGFFGGISRRPNRVCLANDKAFDYDWLFTLNVEALA